MPSRAKLAVEKVGKSMLLPVTCRRRLFELSDVMATRLGIEFYQDGDALLKALGHFSKPYLNTP